MKRDVRLRKCFASGLHTLSPGHTQSDVIVLFSDMVSWTLHGVETNAGFNSDNIES